MTFSLYEATIPSYLQIIAACQGLLDKAEDWCSTSSTPAAQLIDCKLADDMLPFSYQIKSVHTHSVRAIEGAKAGTFSPDLSEPPGDFTGLRQKLATATEYLETLSKAEIDDLIGGHTTFESRNFQMPFTTENFLLSFSQPNFYFHATTAYDILRSKGVDIGKKDFLGPVRIIK